VDSSRLVAHRGYPLRYPENTLVGIETALRLGAKRVEVDVQLTADREPVLFHDRDLKRICGVPGAVHERKLAELLELHAYDPGSFRDEFRGVHPATLEEFRSLLGRFPEAAALVEVKRISVESFGVETVVETILGHLEPVADRCTVISFAPEVLDEARRRGHEKLGFVLPSWSRRVLAQADALDVDLVLCNVRKLPWTGDLRREGQRLAVYDVVDPRRVEKWVERGADLVETFAIGEMLERLR
jgi:glycerophosphoryl diester phosphodiesterase